MGVTDAGPLATTRRGRLRHDASILRTYLGLGVLNLVQYRSDFVLSVVNAAITLLTQLLGLSVVFAQTTDLAGWRSDDLLVLVGVHFLIGGLIGLVLRPSMEMMMEGIRQGTFDFTLVKPADSQLLASIQVVRPQALVDVVVGLGVIVFATTRLGGALGPVDVGLFLLTLVCGVVVIYSFILALSTMAFWFVRLDNVLAIFQSLFGQAGRWPITIFPGWLRVMLTFVVPVAFAVTVPSQALTGRLDLVTTLGAVGVALVFFAASRWFWFFALRRYTGASA
ncbi:ABC transporter permease [Auraticoccus monumenti]|uniref:ABC-2 type transport system permease protein n=1 Tax=Auraticoccus monumenti TaxID=675864 RepID=A0A1G6UD23_9ACTN|nr:ABC-2 family transporter protein [Auraticoccus monumenti]SDD39141.1 ABC-2 type transport system permease protein [Auraticoccus monumenti]